ncbi:DUF3558 domain-containing protein [Umezawaea sp. Da 62-37]|uniref:DUF3558 domain-containing protein n=1 Tax=Umezawaea sp. Da 62-37 TaxID=3075927 RepID=UPI0028F732DA|nr:DUF3558 domain-containing protein [Umezawaea sp. Da 62-37]WNV83749.1 DUF3558 domain-containing protein [Umezawaea sp. Da 62-37]
MSRHLGVAAALLLLTACGTSETGTAEPVASASGASAVPSASSSASPSTNPSSDRPKEIRIDGKNPCDLMTSQDAAAIAVTTASRQNVDQTFKSPNCTFEATGAFWNITTVVTEGFEVWTGGKRQGQPTTIEPVGGFPAITVTRPGDEARCDVAVDVANGQYLFTGFEVSKSFADRFPKPCDGARTVAEAAMRNLTK